MTGIGWFGEPSGPPEPEVGYRPEVVRSLYRALERADLQDVIGSVRVVKVDGIELIELGVPNRVPRDLEPAIREALHGLPVCRIFWRPLRPWRTPREE